MSGISNFGLIGGAAGGAGIFAGGTAAAATSSNSVMQAGGIAAATAAGVGGLSAAGIYGNKAYKNHKAAGDTAAYSENARLMPEPQFGAAPVPDRNEGAHDAFGDHVAEEAHAATEPAAAAERAAVAEPAAAAERAAVAEPAAAAERAAVAEPAAAAAAAVPEPEIAPVGTDRSAHHITSAKSYDAVAAKYAAGVEGAKAFNSADLAKTASEENRPIDAAEHASASQQAAVAARRQADLASQLHAETEHAAANAHPDVASRSANHVATAADAKRISNDHATLAESSFQEIAHLVR